MSWAVRLRQMVGERDWVMTLLSIAGVVGLGVLVGSQYVMPDKRVLALSAAVVLLGIAWRLDLLSGIGVLILALPFPRYISFGTTSIAFVLLLTVIWLLRYTQREALGPRRTPVDAPILLLLMAYVLSFYNVEAKWMSRALLNTVLFVSCLLTFYLITSAVRTEAQLRRLHFFQTISIGLIYLFCVWELAFPSSVLIPGWIDLRSTELELTAIQGHFRVGGPWTDYELLSEFAGMNAIFFMFMIAQARSTTRKVVFTLFLLAAVFIEFTTVTRGGMAALAVGLLYLFFLVRRRINIVHFVIVGVVTLMILTAISFTLQHYTSAGNIFERFGETKLINGMPDSRAPVWPQAWERWMQNPILGGGPYYSADRGLRLWYWPHNLPLFIGCCFGFLGFSAFTWLMVKLWQLSRPITDRLGDPNYAAAYLIVARVSLVIFLVDELKIEYLRNPNYQFQPWILWATLVSASLAVRVPVTQPAPARPTSRPALAPAPARS